MATFNIRQLTQLLAFILSLTLLSLSSGNVQAAPKAELWAFWQPTSGTVQSAVPQFQTWQRFLDTYVKDYADGLNRVDYASVTATDKQQLKQLLNEISAIDPRGWSPAEQKTFWINTYNLAVVSLVLDHYPLESIRDIRLSFKSLFNGGPWEDKYLTVAGQELSLNDIEHRILRPIWPDRRLHFALNCASIGCPNLATDIYQPESLEQQLDAAEQDFLNNNRAVFWQPRSKTLQLSSIFDWYQIDFAGNEVQLLNYLQQQGAVNHEILNDPQLKVSYDYDWNLNIDS
ncbi:DUF547 domain-containing protein [Aliamphritea ceti]|uniref:DUF547 domain-containing protein n=1 Tax=Aliamphritea ceti TaxID=1524258 RepID=UPI0021C43C30|nr:DUF547 domain-containing protein [Aliamphritea ceti]